MVLAKIDPTQLRGTSAYHSHVVGQRSLSRLLCFENNVSIDTANPNIYQLETYERFP
jgi:hypothetical protein